MIDGIGDLDFDCNKERGSHNYLWLHSKFFIRDCYLFRRSLLYQRNLICSQGKLFAIDLCHPLHGCLELCRFTPGCEKPWRFRQIDGCWNRNNAYNYSNYAQLVGILCYQPQHANYEQVSCRLLHRVDNSQECLALSRHPLLHVDGLHIHSTGSCEAHGRHQSYHGPVVACHHSGNVQECFDHA